MKRKTDSRAKAAPRQRRPETHDQRMRRLLKAKRASMWKRFYDSFFLLGGMALADDTYKRTMATADDLFALEPAGYTLTPRKALPDAPFLCMAGHEVVSAQWFRRGIKRSDIELMRYHCQKVSTVKAFPGQLWDRILDEQPGREIRLPVTKRAFPGGFVFPVLPDKPKVPCVSYTSKYGAVASMLEPAECRYSTPMIQATLARLLKMATPHDAEFGMRAAPDEVMSIALLIARYIGSGGSARLTSNDQAEFMDPVRFRSIGTMGHELMCCHQELGKSLAQAEFEAMDLFVTRMQSGMLLTDLVDSESVGLINAMKVLARHPDAVRVGIRLDSGDIPGQCVLYHGAMRYVLHITGRTIVFENEVTHETIRHVRAFFQKAFEAVGVDPEILFPGLGGYWWKVHRDAVSMAFKRSATMGNGNVKFSNSPGKESLPGYLEVFGRGRTLIIGDVREVIDAEPLYVDIVRDGVYVYDESFDDQAARSEATYGYYNDVVLSPMVRETLDAYMQMRAREREAALPAVQEILQAIERGKHDEALRLLQVAN